METKSIMIVGVGGQGSLLASRIIGNVLLSQGFDVKVSEVHGMSQRGGSVVTYVKYGDKVYSPVIEKGEADIIAADALALAEEAGNAKASNVVLMGLIASKMSFDESVWKEAIKNCVPEKFLELNLKAFDLGKNI